MKTGLCMNSVFRAFGVSAALLAASIQPSFAGGGGGTGDGFPRRAVKQEPMSALPSQTELQSLLSGIARELPTLSKLLNDAVIKFESGGYHLVRLLEDDPNNYASYNVSRANEADGSPKEATIQFWSGFFNLPATDDAAETAENNRPSQAKVILHELIHVLFTGGDEDATARATGMLYRLGRGGELSLDELRLVREELGESAAQTGEAFEQVRARYLKARALSAACADFGRSQPLAIGGRQLVLPTLPAGHAMRIGLDPFYWQYREKCLLSLPQGYLLKQYIGYGCTGSHCSSVDRSGIFRDPEFLGRLLEYVTGKPVRIAISEKGVAVADAEDFQNALLANTGFLTGQLRKISMSELERVLPGFGAWKQAYLETNPDLTADWKRLEIDYRKVMMLPLHALNGMLKSGDALQLRAESGAKASGVVLEAAKDRVACRILSVGGSDTLAALESEARLRCNFRHSGLFGDSFNVQEVSLDLQRMWDYWRSVPHRNPHFVSGKATMQDDYFGMILDL